MNNLSHIIRMELTLYWRGRAIWIVALVLMLLGVTIAAQVRGFPPMAWSFFTFFAPVITLILALTTGDQISRDQERLDGVLLSTPVSTGIYVLGKYLAALLLLFGLAGTSLLAAILADQFYNLHQPFLIFPSSDFPPLGPRSYLVGWLYIFLVPVIFGAAFGLATTTLTRGQRILASSGILLMWLPSAFAQGRLPELLDILTFFTNSYQPFNDPIFLLAIKAERILGTVHAPDPTLTQQVIRLVQQNMPPPYLPLSFLWNRLFFLGLAVALVGATTYIVRQQRKGIL